jgi:hypothetical protein
MSSGEQKAWETLGTREPHSVCTRALADFQSDSGIYTLKSYGVDISISLQDKKIFTNSPEGAILLQRLGYFSQHSILWYLINAKDIPLSGELIKPVNLKGGQLFFRGTHELPLKRVAEQYTDNITQFLARGKQLHGEPLKYGDASVRLLPFPRIPIIVILWRADEEFPARADLLLDSTCELHMPLDIIWSTAMMSLLIML